MIRTAERVWAVLLPGNRHRCGVFCCLMLLALSDASPAATALLRSTDDLILLLRVNDLERTSEKVRTLLAEIHRTTPPADPVRNLVGSFLRNKSLSELAPGAFLEVAVFHLKDPKESSCAAAFRITDATAYQKHLQSQSKIIQESVSDDVIQFRDDTRGTPVSLYLTSTVTGFGIFGTGRRAVLRARDLYEESGPGGLSHGTENDILVWINMLRLLRAHEQTITSGLAQLREDIMQDSLGSTKQGHALALALDTGFGRLQALAAQTHRLDAGIAIDNEAVFLQARVRPRSEGLLRICLTDGLRQASSLQLGSVLPPACAYRENTLIWSSLWDAVWEAGETVARAGMGGMVDEETQGLIGKLHDSLKQAGPREVATGILPPPPGGVTRAPVRIKVVRWKQPSEATVVLDDFRALLRAESIREFLSRYDISFDIIRSREKVSIGNTPVERLSLDLRMRQTTEEKKPNTPSRSSRRDYLIAHRGPDTVIVTSRDLNQKGGRPAHLAADRACRQALQEVIAGLDGTGDKPAKTWYQEMIGKNHGGETVVASAAFELSQLLLLALDTAEDWNIPQSRAGHELRSSRYATGFRDAVSESNGLVKAVLFLQEASRSARMESSVEATEFATLRVRIPRGALTSVARSCLGITGSSDQ